MTFARFVENDNGERVLDKNGNPIQIRNRCVIDCQKAIKDGEQVLVEQSHKEEVDINNIIKKHGIDLISQVNALRAQEFQFDDVTGNDFQEAMEKVLKAQDQFDRFPVTIAGGLSSWCYSLNHCNLDWLLNWFTLC